MPRLALYLLLPLLLLLSFHSTAESAAFPPDPAAVAAAANFIRVSCRATRYPALCIHSLSTYAPKIRQSHKQLAQTALAVSLAKARSAVASVSKMTKLSGMKPIERQAVKDCVDTMADSVDQLGSSLRELGRTGPGGKEFTWHMSNVQTWVSAALTDENTCVDGFSGPGMDGKVKAAIKKRVVGVAQVTSNALALVNRFAARARHGPRPRQAAAARLP
ncbi:21 kDa protein-like [Diospyros lotus]|uniref:21 kDa protein-like n=1 Tax=Diospyros lotus TaxID=55363 RepID=UPI0022541997|nr:21 kDa protein-like [Diospyros lotus]